MNGFPGIFTFAVYSPFHILLVFLPKAPSPPRPRYCLGAGLEEPQHGFCYALPHPGGKNWRLTLDYPKKISVYVNTIQYIYIHIYNFKYIYVYYILILYPS